MQSGKRRHGRQGRARPGASPALRRSGVPKNEHRTPCKARNETTGAESTPGRPFSTIIGGLNYEIQHSQCGTDMRSTSKNHNDTPCTVRNGLLWTADILVRIMGCLDLRKDEDAGRCPRSRKPTGDAPPHAPREKWPLHPRRILLPGTLTGPGTLIRTKQEHSSHRGYRAAG